MKKSIILLTIECLRADHMHFLGYPKPVTPTLDMLARKGMVFSNAMTTSSWTPASFFSIHTSLYPLMCAGIISPTEQTITVAESLKMKGYKTAAFHTTSWLSPFFGWNRGFDVFECAEKEPTTINVLRKFTRARAIAEKFGQDNPVTRLLDLSTKYYDYMVSNQQLTAKMLNQKAFSWLQNNLNKKKFLWIHYMEPHEPYYPQSKYVSFSKFFALWKLNDKVMKNRAKRKRGEVELSEQEVNELINLYDLQIKTVDQEIGELIRKIRSLEMGGDTYFIITGDHGQGFMEHGIFGHGLELYDELVHVPLIIFGPNIQPAKVDSVVSLRNLALTVLDLSKINASPFFLGNSLLNERELEDEAKDGIICEESRKIRNQISIEGGIIRYTEPQQRKWAIVTNNWKYIFRKDGKSELYDRKKDPEETTDVSQYKRNITRKFEKKIKSHIHFEKSYSMSQVKSKLRRKMKECKE